MMPVQAAEQINDSAYILSHGVGVAASGISANSTHTHICQGNKLLELAENITPVLSDRTHLRLI